MKERFDDKMMRPGKLLSGWDIAAARPWVLSISLSRNYDLVLALFVAAVVALFVLPLPTAMMDALISINLAASILLLTVSTYLPSAVSFSSFPALLLFTTLFRLSLNIASCKLILLHANAGHIIDTFGRLIVGGNVVVGGVVFLVIAVVQFIVIAKGSERVAEVGARFSLDAMPGKQMSIDADLRAGVISSDEARHRREMLEQESQLHGAMDGAMKFVKGDAIAGIIIAFINIVAGIAVGTLMHDMSVGGAIHRYSVLTVGDGMASQIPSLLVSIAAGIVTTRVATRDARERHLGEQIGAQVAAHPRAMVIAALVLLSFLLVPGFPKWAFGALALVLGGLGVSLLRRRGDKPSLNLIALADAAGEGEGEGGMASHAAGVTALVAVRLSDDLKSEINLTRLQAALSSSKSKVDADIGPLFPRINLAYGVSGALGAAGATGVYQITVQDVQAASGQVRPGWLLWDGQSELPAVIEKHPSEPFGPFAHPVWIQSPAGQPPLTERQGWSCEQVIATHVEQVVRKHASALIGIQEVQHLVQLVRRDHAELVAELMRLVPLQRITEVLRRLLMEHIPVRNLRVIFESLIAWAPKEPEDTIALVEMVRVDLHRLITDRYCGEQRSLEVILFEQSLQERIEANILRSKQGSILGLERPIKQEICDQVKRIADLAQRKSQLAVMVSLNARRYVKTLLEPLLPDLPVLSYQEIEEDVQLQTVGWVMNPP
ncbi:type III secretion system export apparatus subunit SctV [Pandoraea sp.]|uniref:type III secretion system export apparatus subunit SctV n=1 Tax=Pandoraea sp. TaxID=1883445 RepID=UPI0025E55FCA|nr:type III secretion system export apparatus subunit SctV [Pandoraea sp.]